MVIAFNFLPVFIMIAHIFQCGNVVEGKFVSHSVNQLDKLPVNHDFMAHIQAIIKGTAMLPCDLSPSIPNDTVILVVWYKDEHSPMYSYDTRDSHRTVAKHWQSGNLDTRAFFRVMTEPPTLSIDNVNEKDEGEYRCRIDYLRSPTKNVRVKLTVIVPPKRPTIVDEKGQELHAMAGPYEEDGEMKFTCIVTGGKPPPTIKWWRGEQLLESTEIHSGFQNVKSNQLHIKGLQRSDQHAMYTCQATNNNITQPLSTTATIEIYLRPLVTEFLTNNNPYSADRRYEIQCQTYGSRPPAKIVWFLENRELKAPHFNFSTHEQADGNLTTSTLAIVPTRIDNGKVLTCRASNHLVQSGVEEATVKLNVFYAPILLLSLGSSLNPDDIEEGDDVYFECKVNSNPTAYKVLWKHNDQVMQHNQKSGVIMSSSDLALQAVTRDQSGNYTCVASNVEGDGDSNVVNLKIMYKPVCRPNQKQVYGAGRNEKIRVVCEVEAYPPPENFRWSFNNSAESVDVAHGRFDIVTQLATSTLAYAPVSELDYGTVLCWASNLAGRQDEPCTFQVIAADHPDPPYNCSITNHTGDALEVECTEAFDGGQTQFFVLEVKDQLTSVLQMNVSAKYPVFSVSGLATGTPLNLSVYAVNAKGRSDAVILEPLILKVAERQTVLSLGAQDNIEIVPILGILVGIVATLLLTTVVILGVVKMKTYDKREERQQHSIYLHVKDKAYPLPYRSSHSEIFEKDDKNPDVIPSNKDSDYHSEPMIITSSLSNSLKSRHKHAAVMTNTKAISFTDTYADRSLLYQHMCKSNEVPYRETALARPTTLNTAVNCGDNQYGSLTRIRDDSAPAVHMHVDHHSRLGGGGIGGVNCGDTNINRPPLTTSPMTSGFPIAKPLYHKEVVTVRTPLIGGQQESCV